MMNSVCELKPAILLACGALFLGLATTPAPAATEIEAARVKEIAAALAPSRWCWPADHRPRGVGEARADPGLSALRGAPGTKAVPEACAGAARRILYLISRRPAIAAAAKTRAQRTLEPPS